MKYVACYCRVSTEEQKKFGFSIQAQKDALVKYCKENGYKYEFYIDEGISASSMKKRKALNEMLSKVNIFDMILFTKLDRLSRNVLDANNINKLLIDNKCTMKAIDEDDIDTSTADGTFIFNLKVSLAQREIGKTSERIKFVFENKRSKGETTSGTKKYGYDIINKKFIINKEEANNIVNLYEFYKNVNGNVKKTYLEFFLNNFKNKGMDALYYYLRDTAYIGKYKLYRKDIYIDDYIPRIMSDDLFYSVQQLHKKKEHFQARSSSIGLFCGLVYCNKCKIKMSKSTDNRVKRRLIRYVCDNASRRKAGTAEYKCKNSTMVREEIIENYLLENLNKLIGNTIKNSYIIKPIEKKDNSSKIKTIENKLFKLKDLYIDDLIDKATYEKDYKKYKKEIEDLNQQKEQPQKDYSNLQKLINSNWQEIYNSLSLEEKRTFWLNIINQIYIEDGEIKEITFL